MKNNILVIALLVLFVVITNGVAAYYGSPQSTWIVCDIMGYDFCGNGLDK